MCAHTHICIYVCVFYENQTHLFLLKQINSKNQIMMDKMFVRSCQRRQHESSGRIQEAICHLINSLLQDCPSGRLMKIRCSFCGGYFDNLWWFSTLTKWIVVVFKNATITIATTNIMAVFETPMTIPQIEF